MQTKKGNIHVGVIVSIIVILLITITGSGYYIYKKNVPTIKVGADGVSVKVNGLDVETNSNGSVSVNAKNFNANVDDDEVSLNAPGVNANVNNEGVSLNVDGANINVSGDDNTNIMTNIVLIFDASGSMAAQSGNNTRMDAAKKAMKAYVNNLNNNEHLSVLVYGHKGDNTQAGKTVSCNGIEEIYYMGAVDANVVISKLDRLQPNGWTPITASLQKAADILNKNTTPGTQKHIVLLSDGEESCGFDPVAKAKQLKAEGIIIDVIGLDVSGIARTQLNNISINGGGVYYSANAENLNMIVSDMGVKLNTGNLDMNVNDDSVNITGDNGLDLQVDNDGASVKMDGIDLNTNDNANSPSVSIPSF